MIDEHDRRLLAHVRPHDWRNPDPKPVYDLVVVGGGTAGLVCAAGAAGLGARVALVERALLGGDCLNTGCVPSKALLRSARVVAEAQAGARLGVLTAANVDFAAVMTRLRARRADIAPHDSAARLASLGVDVFFGTATFASPRAIAVRWNKAKDSNASPDSNDPNDPNVLLRFRKAVVATGSRPAVPPIPGLAGTPFLTSETVFSLTEQPRELVVLGAGPIGCELAQAFALLGTRVTLVESAPQVLPREDLDAAALVSKRLERDAVQLRLGVQVTDVSRVAHGIAVAFGGERIGAEALLVATGRAPNVEGLGLDAAGVGYGAEGVDVDAGLRTRNPRVYASGDVCSHYKFTHAADALSRIAVQNALFFGRKRTSTLVIPWCTFTAPEVAHVGMTAAEAAGAGAETITVPLSEVDRSIVDGEEEGFVRVHHVRGRIRGATIVAPAAGELIGLVAMAMRQGQGLADLAATIFPYPTVAMALRQAGDTYRRRSLTPAVRKALQYYFRWSTPG